MAAWQSVAARGSGAGRGVTTWPPRGAAQGAVLAPSRALWTSFLERLRAWVRAEAGAGRLLPWVPVAFGAGIALYFTASREPVLSVSIVTAAAFCLAAFLLRRSRFFRRRRHGHGHCGGICHRDHQDQPRIAHSVLARPLFGVADRLCRDPRHQGKNRSLRAARDRDGGAAPVDQARARAAVGQKGHCARGRRLCRTEGTPAAAARAVAARRLRLLARSVLSGHRWLRFCDGRDQGGRTA